LTLSAITAEIMSAVIADEAPPFAITPFALDRFQ
jgi:glycine/D-amino acid oxidase-like deaminating enzyme